MPSSGDITRRSLIAAISGSSVVGATGAASAQNRGQGQQDHRGRETTPGEQVVIQYESCFTVHVRGRPQNIEVIEVGLFFYDEDGLDATGVYYLTDPDPPLTINASETPYADRDPYISSVSVSKISGPTTNATAPDAWNCWEQIS